MRASTNVGLVHRAADAERRAEAAREGRLARAELAVSSDQVAGAQLGGEPRPNASIPRRSRCVTSHHGLRRR